MVRYDGGSAHPPATGASGFVAMGVIGERAVMIMLCGAVLAAGPQLRGGVRMMLWSCGHGAVVAPAVVVRSGGHGGE
ncbi:MAG: hypothetical protein NW215_03955 [Hyphomicrobiales bacterium]|nr:hypothetical protein [Hyphomicrobiales bacterium]